VHASFLGALARVRLATDGGEVLAQLPAVEAAGLGPGTPVTWRLTATPALAVPPSS
jgi:putative spermidine/putrescine transport system ATP-binding protein